MALLIQNAGGFEIKLLVEANTGDTITISCTGQTSQSYTLGTGETYHAFNVVQGIWTATNGSVTKTTNVEHFGTYNVDLTYKIVSWTDGTDAEVTAMIAAAYAGKIDIYDYWRVGDERIIALSASTEQAAQNARMTLMQKGSTSTYTFTDGTTKPLFIVGQFNVLTSTMAMNNTDTNTGSWRDSKLRTFLNGNYRDSFPDTIKSIFRQFNCITGQYTSSGGTAGGDNITTQDYFSLFAEKEVFGRRTYSATNEASVLAQIEFYDDSDHRDAGTIHWWLRSPCTTSKSGQESEYPLGQTFCDVDSGVVVPPTPCQAKASAAQYARPFGCI